MCRVGMLAGRVGGGGIRLGLFKVGTLGGTVGKVDKKVGTYEFVDGLVSLCLLGSVFGLGFHVWLDKTNKTARK